MKQAIISKPDVLVSNEGSIFLFTPMTDAASAWLHANVEEDAQWFGLALVCEHRFALDLAHGLASEGFILAGN